MLVKISLKTGTHLMMRFNMHCNLILFSNKLLKLGNNICFNGSPIPSIRNTIFTINSWLDLWTGNMKKGGDKAAAKLSKLKKWRPGDMDMIPTALSTRIFGFWFLFWRKLEKGWYKLNMDGVRNRPTGNVAVGGLIRDEHGFWMGGFQASLGCISILNAELKAVQLGLQMVCHVGKGVWQDNCGDLLCRNFPAFTE